jgi:hypothetical protein
LIALHFNQALNILGFQQEVDRHLVEAGFFQNRKSGLFNVLITNEQEIAEERQAPPVKVQITLPVKLPVSFDYALRQGW